MNGVPEYYELKMKQTSKGIWYCDGLVAYDEDANVVAANADMMMKRIESILEHHNKEAVASEQKKK